MMGMGALIMKLSPNTLTLLKNFSSINQAIRVKPGSILETRAPTKTIIGRGKTDQTFSQQFAIADLSKLLGTLDLFEEPDVEFGEKSLTIRTNGRSADIVYADPAMIVTVPEKAPSFPSIDVKFSLKKEELHKTRQAQAVLHLPEFVALSSKGALTFGTMSTQNPTSDAFSIKVGDSDKKFRVVFHANDLRIIPDDYNVEITAKGVSHWVGNIAEYYIAVQNTSKFS